MIQLLFAGIFVSVILPVLWTLGKSRHQAEARLSVGGRFTCIGIALFLALIGADQITHKCGYNVLSFFGGSPSTVNLVNHAVFDMLIGIPIHEFGHFLFMPLGTTMHILGGSLLEVGLPAALFVWFLLERCARLACISLFFVAHRLFYVSWYMSSARSRRDGFLALSLDQNPDHHDWYQLFNRWGLLEQDTQIAFLTRVMGVVVLVLALVFLVLLPSPQEVESDSEIATP